MFYLNKPTEKNNQGDADVNENVLAFKLYPLGTKFDKETFFFIAIFRKVNHYEIFDGLMYIIIF